MLTSFNSYFFHFIFGRKNRQWPLCLAFLGLVVSAFSIFVLQSVMSGLQRNQIVRAKAVEGQGVITLQRYDQKIAKRIQQDLSKIPVQTFLEYETELLAQVDGVVYPVILHGIDDVPKFLQGFDRKGVIIPSVLASRMGVARGDDMILLSPAHYNHFLQEAPRSMAVDISDFVNTDVPEIDDFHLWMRLPALQNLIRERSVNRIRIYGEEKIFQRNKKVIRQLLKEKYPGTSFESWSERNKMLVWSLSLESKVMSFLFISMSLLVGLSITSGLSLFYDKIRPELAAFWALGTTPARLEWANFFLFNILSVFAALSGLVLGLVGLYFLDVYGNNFFSADFIDQKIPINVTWQGAGLAFLTPYLVGIFFCSYTFRQIKAEFNYLKEIRLVGA